MTEVSTYVPAPVPDGESELYRQTRLGASEVAAALGYNPHCSPYTLWARKKGLLPPRGDTGAASLGRFMEAYIRQWFNEVRKDIVACVNPNPPSYQHPTVDELLASPDGQVVYHQGVFQPGFDTGGLECKWRGMYDRDDWGEPGTEQVPTNVLFQCMVGMACTGWRRWHVAVIWGTGEDRALYEVPRNEELISLLTELSRQWVQRYLRGPGVPPIDGSANTTAAIKARFPQYSDMRLVASTADTLLAADYYHAKRELKELENEVNRIANELKERIGDRTGIQGAEWKASWTKVQPKDTVAWELVARRALAQCPPGFADKVIRECTETPGSYRRFNFSVNKEIKGDWKPGQLARSNAAEPDLSRIGGPSSDSLGRTGTGSGGVALLDGAPAPAQPDGRADQADAGVPTA